MDRWMDRWVGVWVDGQMDKLIGISRPAVLASKRSDSRDQGQREGRSP